MKEYTIRLVTGGNKYSTYGGTFYTYDILADDADEARGKAIDKWESSYGTLTEKERGEMFDRARYGVKK